jgi:hypothetical protein
MKTSLRIGTPGLLAVSILILSLFAGCLEEDSSVPVAPVVPQPPPIGFPLGPFYGFDSLRHYEYSITLWGSNSSPHPGSLSPDSTGHVQIVTKVGYGVTVTTPGPDTIHLEIGTRLRKEYIDVISPISHTDTTYDTLYASYTYLREGTGFVVLGTTVPPFPFLDRAYVAECDTSSAEMFKSSLTIDNLSAALGGEQAEYTHVFTSSYAGGGSSSSTTATYRQGIGMKDYFTGSAYAGFGVTLVGAKP